uniref:transcription antitermination factor NusB n=1 Tax=Collinsella intestinalis TaxID=147207 RepID=UPI004027BF71
AVVINEAVEIAKAYGTDESAGFVNGVLGRIVRDRHLPSLQHVACTITAEDAEAACLAALWFEIDPKRLAAEEEAARARFEADDYGFAEDDLDHIFNDPFDAEAGE